MRRTACLGAAPRRLIKHLLSSCLRLSALLLPGVLHRQFGMIRGSLACEWWWSASSSVSPQSTRAGNKVHTCPGPEMNSRFDMADIYGNKRPPLILIRESERVRLQAWGYGGIIEIRRGRQRVSSQMMENTEIWLDASTCRYVRV